MKIIYLHQYFNTPSMNGSTRSYEMARRLVIAGHEVEMITSSRSLKQKDEYRVTYEAGIRVHWLPVEYSNHFSYFRRILAFIRFAYAAGMKAKELEGDVIFATSTPLTIAIPAVFASKMKNIPMVFEVRDLWPEVPIAIGALKNPVLCWLARKLEIWAYQNSSAVIALSPGMREGVIRAGYPENRVAVIPNSSDNKEFAYDSDAAFRFRESREWLRNRPLIVYTGTFGKINGVTYMVDLAKILLKINPEIRILLVGEGAEKKLVRQQAIDNHVLGVNLFIEESLAKTDISSLLSAANMTSSVTIDLPEIRANSANKFFDSLAAGKPILLNYGGWQHDIVKSANCGLAMWQKPIEEVAEEVAKNIVDKAWLERAGRAAKDLAENEFDRDILAKQFFKVIELVVNKKENEVSLVAPGIYQ